jgi:D-glycero-D-manno-heptose 1,7-bisphosphate phosphatase
VFLDRDGTLIVDVGYPGHPAQVRLLDGVVEALRSLQGEGYLLVVISNQSGVGRGLITSEQAENVHRRVASLLAENGVRLVAAYHCPHSPEEHCDCRKPSPGLLLRAARDLNVDLSQSVLVGDKPSDISAGKAAGCRTVLLGRRDEGVLQALEPDHLALDWNEAVQFIVGNLRESPC